MFLDEPELHEPLAAWLAYRYALRYYDDTHPIVADAIKRADAHIDILKDKQQRKRPPLEVALPNLQDTLAAWEEFLERLSVVSNDNDPRLEPYRLLARPIIDAKKQNPKAFD